MNTKASLVATALLALVCSSGCGDSCEDALLAMCEKGCECSTTGGCNVRLEGGTSISGTSADACVESLKRFENACSGDDDTDYDACQEDLDGAECDGGGIGALVAPASCTPGG
ncbi:MAG: hypothetical protein JRI23_14370 [Deltaproteobacteria bacterium]|jgi:hypothetical protein|nr:hypothetical protein [Deltaproteobacteria bacterium]MBW2532930.1 hypothetical protein [Deltaproteobacteria bacterium]